MPQEFNVLQCYKCQTFQVHQVKKSTKWNCKLCGEKQSIKKVFGRGSGYDCRQHVQKLNLLRAEQGNRDTIENQCSASTDAGQSSCSFIQYDNDINDDDEAERNEKLPQTESGKWSKYVDITEEMGDNSETTNQPDESGEEMYTTDKSKFDGFQKQKRMARKRNWQQNSKRSDEYSKDNPTSSANNFRAIHPFKEQQTVAMDTASDENIYNKIKSRNKLNHKTDKPFAEGSTSKQDFSSLTFTGQSAKVRGYGYPSEGVNDTGINNSSKLTDIFDSRINQEETVKSKESTTTIEAKSSKWGQFVEDETMSSSDDSDDDQGIYFTVNPVEKFQESQSSQEEESDSSNCQKYFHHKIERSPKGFVTNKFPAFKKEELFSPKVMNGVKLSQDNVTNFSSNVLYPINTNTNATGSIMKKGGNSANKQKFPLSNNADDTEIVMNCIQKQPGTKHLFKVDDLNDEDLDFEI
ncbi:MRN complex-interacting protein-like [Mytilus edulis]|uniref:MRN complex-interacting protein-like n=1 Tax=Mytilus edulis TaxID=6550 RepID=UPI0039F0740B